MSINYTDGGRSEAGMTHERKDCTVRAAAIALEVTYADAHMAFAMLGRKCGRGFSFGRFAVTEMRLVKRVTPRCRVSTALRLFAKGRFVFRIRGHVFAVVNGLIHDQGYFFDSLKNCIVTHVWEATPKAQTVEIPTCTPAAV